MHISKLALLLRLSLYPLQKQEAIEAEEEETGSEDSDEEELQTEIITYTFYDSDDENNETFEAQKIIFSPSNLGYNHNPSVQPKTVGHWRFCNLLRSSLVPE